MVIVFMYAVTQDDQDRADLAKEQEATQNLVETWLQRLQLISVIVSNATFCRTQLMSNYSYIL